MKRIIFLIILFSAGTFVFAQENTPAKTSGSEEGVLYTKGTAYGLSFNTSGWGLDYRNLKHKTGTLYRIIGLDFSTRRHHQEIKMRSNSGRRTDSYYYGKLHSVFAFRPEIGYIKTLYDKEISSAVRISYVGMIGPSFTWAKPVYLQIRQNTNGLNSTYITQKYSPQWHNTTNIVGRERWSVGLNESVSYIGLYTKQGVNFDYAPQDDIYKSMELGVVLEAFLQGPLLMAYKKRQNVFIDLYVSISFGSKNY